MLELTHTIEIYEHTKALKVLGVVKPATTATLIFTGERRVVNFPSSYSTRFNPSEDGEFMQADSTNFLLYLLEGDPYFDLTDTTEYTVKWRGKEGKIKLIIFKNRVINGIDREIQIQPYG